MTLPVSHYLDVYKLRQSMARNGVTRPNEEGRRLIDRLVERLSDLDPGMPCDLKHLPAPGGEWIAFIAGGNEVARIWVAESDG